MKQPSIDIKHYSALIVAYLRNRTNTLSFFGMHQYADWKTLVYLFMLIGIVVVGLVTYLFVSIQQQGDAYEIVAVTSVDESVNKKSLQKVIDYYNQKEVEMQTLISEQKKYLDPSL
jgi:hypothetical protein